MVAVKCSPRAPAMHVATYDNIPNMEAGEEKEKVLLIIRLCSPSTLRMGCVLRPGSRQECSRKERRTPPTLPQNLPHLSPELYHMTSLGCKGEWEMEFLD